MQRICVFCGSSPGAHPDYVRAARELGSRLAQANLTLVYGGGRVGMMGQLAQAAVEAGGQVIGVIPRRMVQLNVAFTELSDLRVVDSMHARKALMAELADGFIALPGGLGTLEEFFEVLTWAQLGMHTKPCGLLTVRGYYDRLLEFLEVAVAEQFISPAQRSLWLVADDVDSLLALFGRYQPTPLDKAAWALGLSQMSAPRPDPLT